MYQNTLLLLDNENTYKARRRARRSHPRNFFLVINNPARPRSAA